MKKNFYSTTYFKLWNFISNNYESINLNFLSKKKSQNIIKEFFGYFGFFYCTSENLLLPNSLKKAKKIYLVNYFQNKMYNYKVLNELKNQFKPINFDQSKYEEFLCKVSDKSSVCVHIRQGDYINNKRHEVCNKTYYLEGIKEIKSRIQNPVFIIFSDDKSRVKEYFKHVPDVVFEPENITDTDCLYLMSLCKNFIISNSSFSWWAQALSDNISKVVIAPDRWVNDPLIKYDLKDKNWIIINTNNRKYLK